jgi:hypothetical protein
MTASLTRDGAGEDWRAVIHGDAVKHGHARTPDDWPFSSWHRYKREDGLP